MLRVSPGVTHLPAQVAGGPAIAAASVRIAAGRSDRRDQQRADPVGHDVGVTYFLCTETAAG